MAEPRGRRRRPQAAAHPVRPGDRPARSADGGDRAEERTEPSGAPSPDPAQGRTLVSRAPSPDPAEERTPVSRAPSPDPAVAQEQGARGALHLADRVVQKIARRAALDAPGVAPAGAATGRVGAALGGGYPDVDVDLAGTHARVTLKVASLWPHPVSEVAAGVRESVTRALHELAAVDADSVAVHVAAVVQPAPPSKGRVR